MTPGTAGKAAALLLIPVLALQLTPLVYASQLHRVEMTAGSDRVITLSGELRFNAGRWLYINNKPVDNGTSVRIVIHGVKNGDIWIGSSGWASIDIPDADVYVNDELWIYRGHVSIYGGIMPGSLWSSLVLRVEDRPAGYLRLVVDDEAVVDYWNDSSRVELHGLTRVPDGALNIANDLHYVEGAVSEVIVNGREVSAVTAGGLAVLAATGGLLALWRSRR